MGDYNINILNCNSDNETSDFIDSMYAASFYPCTKKKITKKQQKSLPKPWLTKGILKSIKVKNKTYKQFCKSTDPLKKNELHIKFKTYRNSIVKLTRQCKEDYFKSYFENNKKNSKEIWNGIRNLINVKNSKKTQQIALNINNQSITDDFFLLLTSSIISSHQ